MANQSDVDQKSNLIVEDFKKAAQQGMRPLINDVQDMQAKNPGEFNDILKAANSKLDAAFPNAFNVMDFEGVQNGQVILKNKQKGDVTAIDANGNMTLTTGDGQHQRSVSPDGSVVDRIKLADGQFHTQLVKHPDGEITQYKYDTSNSLQIQSVIETKADGTPVSTYTHSGNTWTLAHGTPNAFQPAQMHGTLTVDSNGTHTFKDSDHHTTFVRAANGAIRLTADATGAVILNTPPVRATAPRPATVPGLPAQGSKM